MEGRGGEGAESRREWKGEGLSPAPRMEKGAHLGGRRLLVGAEAQAPPHRRLQLARPPPNNALLEVDLGGAVGGVGVGV